MAAQVQKQLFTVEDYYKMAEVGILPERGVELINGEIIQLTNPRKKQLFTVAEYHRLAEVGILDPDARVELINGEIIEMSPIKSYHACVVDTLVEELIFMLRSKAIVKGQNPILLADFSEPQPDIVIATFRTHRYRDRHPRPADVFLIIEVADSTLKKDRQIKLPIYAEAGIPEYWIVDVKKKQVEIYQQPDGRVYNVKKIASLSEQITCTTIDFTIALDTIFV